MAHPLFRLANINNPSPIKCPTINNHNNSLTPFIQHIKPMGKMKHENSSDKNTGLILLRVR